MKYAPILVFTYNRLAPLEKAIEALAKNYLAEESQLFIFSDGARTAQDETGVKAVREYLKSIKGFHNITIEESKTNKGLARSIIDGVTHIINRYDKVIVLEDDLITSANFLNFMNQALEQYQSNQRIHSVSGYTVPINIPKDYNYDNYLTMRATSWGWATWKDRWQSMDWEVKDYGDFNTDSAAKRQFNKMGSDMSGMLNKQMSGKINSWAIRWCYNQFKNKQYSIFPVISKVTNIGFGEDATHTSGQQSRFATPLDDGSKTEFVFNPTLKLDNRFIKQFVSKYSWATRIKYKIKKILGV